MKKLSSNPSAHTVNLSRINFNPQVQRSNEGFEAFLRNVYINKRSGGKFLSVSSYLGNLGMFLSSRGIRAERFHRATKVEVIQQKAFFIDLYFYSMKLSSARNLCSTLEAYVEYIRFTQGHYKGSQLQLAA